MATRSIEAVRHLHITPLVTICHPEFGKQYERGLAFSLFEDAAKLGPLHDLYLVDMFTLARNKWHFFDGQHEQELYAHIGYTLGEIHGGVLLADGGTLRPDVSTLVTLHNQDVKHGYRVGREYFFVDATTDEERRKTDAYVIDVLCELADECDQHQDNYSTVRYIIGDLLGNLSGHLFPWTREEHHAYEAHSINIMGSVDHLRPQSLAARQFVSQAVS